MIDHRKKEGLLFFDNLWGHHCNNNNTKQTIYMMSVHST
jgi:hypothetical protein